MKKFTVFSHDKREIECIVDVVDPTLTHALAPESPGGYNKLSRSRANDFCRA